MLIEGIENKNFKLLSCYTVSSDNEGSTIAFYCETKTQEPREFKAEIYITYAMVRDTAPDIFYKSIIQQIQTMLDQLNAMTIEVANDDTV